MAQQALIPITIMFKPVSFLGKLFKWYLLLPAHPAKIRIENRAGKFFFPKGILIKNNDGVTFKLDANDWITRIMIEQGCYELGSITLAKKIIKAGGVFIDVGANFGLYSCMLGFKNNGLKIYSIEPNYRVLHRLTENIEINQLKQQVQIICAAVANKSQLVFLQQPEKNNLGTTVTTLTNNGGPAVLSCPLQLILETNHISEIDLLKIDIEGNEFAVVENFPFDNYPIKNIILEFNFLSPISFAQLKQFFENKGFYFFTITGEKIVDSEKGILENNIWIVNQKFTGQQ